MSTAVPGSSASALRQALQLGQSPYGFFVANREKYGEVFTLRLPGDPVRVVLCHPDDIKTFLALGADDFRSDTQSIHLSIGPRSVLFTDGDRHRRKRQILTPPIHGQRLASYAGTMVEVTDQFIDGWADGEPVACAPMMRRMTFEILMRCVFGLSHASPRGRAISETALEWLDISMSPGMFMASLAVTANRMRRWTDEATERSRRTGRGGILPWKRAAAVKARLVELLLADLRQAREQGVGDREDVLALLAEARYEDGALMEEEDVIDQLVTFLVGGHETTAATLGWAILHLARNPEIVARVRQEMEGRMGAGTFDPLVCGELPYLDAVLREAMRLTPVAPAVARTLTKPVQIREWTIPAGTILWACICMAQRHPDVWEDPNVFRPERFLGTSPPRPDVFLPFGGGRRRCLGATFATFEMRIVLARILDRFDIEPAPGASDATMFAGITVAVKDGVQIVPHARPSGGAAPSPLRG